MPFVDIGEQTPLALCPSGAAIWHHEVQSRGVAVWRFPALGSQKVLADRTQLQQVIVSLAVNAVQAIAQAGSTSRKISIRTVAHDGGILAARLRTAVPASSCGTACAYSTASSPPRTVV
jgi:hypothetical protein